ncbi:MAG: NAD-dependent epimerase/dehydratase family protein [Actinobacteria bacterium]|nr:MAG: NAD-dependent epimerase/dehydratase family protein [Actinomycetota bacterium]
METHGKVAVAGATGRVGRHVVDVLTEQGCEVVAISRSAGVDVVTGDELAEALRGVESVVDASSGASPEQHAATEFFTAATHNLQQFGAQAGVKRIVVVSIIGTDRFTAGYGAAKQVHERAMLAGPIPATVVRAAQFHEFVSQLMDWGRQDGTIYTPKMRTQLVAARTVGELLADLATGRGPAPARGSNGGPILEIAGPREENLVEVAGLLAAHRGETVRIEPVSNPDDPDGALYESGALLPGPHAILAGPTFQEWFTGQADEKA